MQGIANVKALKMGMTYTYDRKRKKTSIVKGESK